MNKTDKTTMIDEPKTYQEAAKNKNLKWQKKRNPMTHLTPKKKKRK